MTGPRRVARRVRVREGYKRRAESYSGRLRGESSRGIVGSLGGVRRAHVFRGRDDGDAIEDARKWTRERVFRFARRAARGYFPDATNHAGRRREIASERSKPTKRAGTDDERGRVCGVRHGSRRRRGRRRRETGRRGRGRDGTRRTPTRTIGNRKRRRLGRRLERRATRAQDATRRRLGREIAARPSREWRRPRRVRHLRGRRFGVRVLVSVGARSGTGRDVAGAASGGVRLRLRRFFSPRAEERVLRGERDVRSEVTPEREHRRGRARLFAGE